MAAYLWTRMKRIIRGWRGRYNAPIYSHDIATLAALSSPSVERGLVNTIGIPWPADQKVRRSGRL
jgi:hypothetical protein